MESGTGYILNCFNFDCSLDLVGTLIYTSIPQKSLSHGMMVLIFVNYPTQFMTVNDHLRGDVLGDNFSE